MAMRASDIRPRPHRKALTIAVIGCGPSGLFFLEELVANGPFIEGGRQTVLFFDPSRSPGRGNAWDPQSEHMLCNMHVDSVLIDTANPAEVRRALGMGKDELFASRFQIGEWLASKWNKAVELAEARGITVRVVRDTVVGVDAVPGDGYQVIAGNGSQRFDVSAVILAIGQLPPHAYGEFRGLEGFHENPWRFQASGNEGRLLVLGTSLTSIDVTIALKSAGHPADVVWASRSGRVPWVRPRTATAQLTRSKEQLLQEHDNTGQRYSLRSVKRDFYRQFLHNGISKAALDDIFASADLPPAESLRRGLQLASNTGKYFAVMKQLDYCIPVVWMLLDPADRAEFRQLYSQYARVSFAMPMINARRVLNWLNNAELQIVSGPFRLTHENGHFVLQRKTTDGVVRQPFDTVINATGLGMDLKSLAADNHLIRHLLLNGLLTTNPNGGAACDFHTGQAHDCWGRPVPGLFMLNGTLNSGARLLTNELLEVAQQARRTANAVLERIAANGRFDPAAIDFIDPLLDDVG